MTIICEHLKVHFAFATFVAFAIPYLKKKTDMEKFNSIIIIKD